jgi:FkbM family methyltransferase
LLLGRVSSRCKIKVVQGEDIKTKRYPFGTFAIILGIASLLRKLGFRNLHLPKIIIAKFHIAHMINFTVSRNKAIQWCYDDLFFDQKLQVSFHLMGSDYYRFTHAYDLQNQGKINFLRSESDIIADIKGLKFQIPFPYGVDNLQEIFIDNSYDYFDIPGKTILDIGAGFGDSPVYFAWKGAKKVVAFEAIPAICAFAAKNIKINNYQEKIELFNEAVGDKEDYYKLNYSPELPETDVRAHISQVINIKMVSINRILKSLRHVDILKIDCEGAEWQILPSAAKEGTLQFIDNIIMEVHVGALGSGSINQMTSFLRRENFKIIKKVFLTRDAWLVVASYVDHE